MIEHLNITIYKRSTVFSIYFEKVDRSFDIYQYMGEQQDPTEVIEIYIRNKTDYIRDLSKIKISILNSLTRQVRQYRTVESNIITTLRPMRDLRKVFKLISNFRYIYELDVDITHTIFSKVDPYRTNCNTITELVFHKLTKFSKTRFNDKLINSVVRLLISYRYNKSRNQDLLMSHTEFANILGYKAYDSSRPKVDKIHKMLAGLGYDIKFCTRSSRVSFELFNKGYPFIPADKNNRRYTLTEMLYNYGLLKDDSIILDIYKEMNNELKEYNSKSIFD